MDICCCWCCCSAHLSCLVRWQAGGRRMRCPYLLLLSLYLPSWAQIKARAVREPIKRAFLCRCACSIINQSIPFSVRIHCRIKSMGIIIIFFLFNANEMPINWTCSVWGCLFIELCVCGFIFIQNNKRHHISWALNHLLLRRRQPPPAYDVCTIARLLIHKQQQQQQKRQIPLL